MEGKNLSSPNGVMQVIEPNYYTVNDVMQLLGVKRSKAYSIISGLRNEMKKSGYLFDGYPAGRVPKSYFNDRCWIGK